MTPTDEQTTILDAARTTSSNLILNALAGCGKTSTLEMIERAVPTKPILYLCFNKRNADEASKRMLSTTTVRTFNSLGHRVWASACAKNLSLAPKKSQDILRSMIDDVKDKATRNIIWDSFWDVIAGVAMAKALGYIPEGKFLNNQRLIERSVFHSTLDESPDDLTSDLIDAVLTKSIQQSYEGVVDFNDQVYMPALFGGTFPRFPLVKVDEAQDLSPINHALLAKLCKASRLIAVGDPWQNIYGFRGAMAEGMATLSARYSMVGLDLSTSFRCPRAIVEAARWRVPQFKWMKDGGHVETKIELQINDIADESAILCRNNAPLFRFAMHLLAAGRSVQVAGSDIGPKLIGIMRKLTDESANRKGVLSAINDWEAERLAKDSTTASDLAACMRVFANHSDSLAQAISYAEHLFAQKGSIRLMTIHKSKGLEFDTVYHLDSWLCKETEQDMNLRYVAQTRSMNNLFEIDSSRIKWDRA